MDWSHFFGQLTMSDVMVTATAFGNAIVIARQKAKDDQIAFLQAQVNHYKDLVKKTS